ncbi:MAG: CdaR family protein [Gemmataceae bacterium]
MMDRLLENDTVLKILSLLVAVAVWVQVNGGVPQTAERPVPNVPVVSTVAPHSTLTVLSIKPSTVTIQLKGPASLVGSTANVTAVVSLTKVTHPGTFALNVAASVPAGTSLVSITPSQVVVTVDVIKTAHMPVKLMTAGKVPTGYGVISLNNPQRTVSVTGPSRDLSQVVKIVGKVVLSGQTGGFAEQVFLFPENRHGMVESHVQVSPQVVTVQVQIAKEQSVPVIVKYTGKPASGFKVTSLAVNPATVVIYGTASALSGVQSISTQLVNISGLSNAITTPVGLVLPSGVSVIGSSTVHATVNIGP